MSIPEIVGTVLALVLVLATCGAVAYGIDLLVNRDTWRWPK